MSHARTTSLAKETCQRWPVQQPSWKRFHSQVPGWSLFVYVEHPLHRVRRLRKKKNSRGDLDWTIWGETGATGRHQRRDTNRVHVGGRESVSFVGRRRQWTFYGFLLFKCADVHYCTSKSIVFDTWMNMKEKGRYRYFGDTRTTTTTTTTTQQQQPATVAVAATTTTTTTTTTSLAKWHVLHLV